MKASPMQQALHRFVEGGAAPGIGVIRGNGQGEIEQAFAGQASIRRGRPMDAETLLPMACVMKLLVSLLTLKLCDEGRIGLDEDIAVAVPELSEGQATGITTRHLLGHVPGYIEPRDTDVRWGYSWERLVAFFPRRTQAFAPGTAWSYTHTGFVILAKILERSAGRPFLGLLDEHVCAPLGVRPVPFEGETAADLHMRSPLSKVFEPVRLPADSGFLRSSISDLALPISALHRIASLMAKGDNETLAPACDRMLTPFSDIPRLVGGVQQERVPTRYGLGVGFYDDQVGINGSFLGSTCAIRIDPVSGETRCLAMNAWSPSARDSLLGAMAPKGTDPGGPVTPFKDMDPDSLVGDYVGLMLGAAPLRLTAEQDAVLVWQGHGPRLQQVARLVRSTDGAYLQPLTPNFALGVRRFENGSHGLWSGTSAYAIVPTSV